MDTTICIDASIALKLFLPESDSLRAQQLWEQWQRDGTALVAPALWAYEVTSVIRNRTHRGNLPAELEHELILALHGLPVQLHSLPQLHVRAWELAQRFDRPAAYDAHYLALAEGLGCPFWTADQRLWNVVRSELPWVHWLGAVSAA